MRDCETLDEVIDLLRGKSSALGEETRALIARQGGYHVPMVVQARVGKTTPFQAVTRGGVPVVLLTSGAEGVVECKTVAELAAQLDTLRGQLGGQTRVLIARQGGYQVLAVKEARTGKGTPFQLVSRGGVPVVVLTSWAG